MDNFAAIYKILKFIELQMDYEEFNNEVFNANTFGLSNARFMAIIAMLIDSGYITGIRVIEAGGIRTMAIIRPQITISGLEYLEDNTMMKKVYKTLKGIKDIIPGC